jgi:hypothetical protein
MTLVEMYVVYDAIYIFSGIVTIQDNLRTLTNAYEHLRERYDTYYFDLIL